MSLGSIPGHCFDNPYRGEERRSSKLCTIGGHQINSHKMKTLPFAADDFFQEFLKDSYLVVSPSLLVSPFVLSDYRESSWTAKNGRLRGWPLCASWHYLDFACTCVVFRTRKTRNNLRHTNTT